MGDCIFTLKVQRHVGDSTVWCFHTPRFLTGNDIKSPPHSTEQCWFEIFATTSYFNCLIFLHQGNNSKLPQGCRQWDKWISHWSRWLKNPIYQRTFRQGLWNHFVIPDLTLRFVTKRYDLPIKHWNILWIQIPTCGHLPRFESDSNLRYIWVFNTHEKTTFAHRFIFLLGNVFILDEWMHRGLY